MGWFFLLFMIALTVGCVIYMRSLHGQAHELEGFTKGMTLPLTDVALTMIPRGLFRANVGGFIGAAPMLVVLIVMTFSVSHSLGFSSISVIGLLMLAGSTLGVAIACTTNIGPSTPELPRVARATQPRMSDYLSPIWVVTGVVVCAAGLVVAVLILPRNTASGWMNSLLAALIVINAVTLAASPWLAHRLLTSPRPANDSLQLAWDDALRAHALRSVWLVPFAVGIAATVIAMLATSILALVLCVWLSRHLLSTPQPASESVDLAWDDALRAHALRGLWVAPAITGLTTAYVATGLNSASRPSADILLFLLLMTVLQVILQLRRPGARFRRRLWPSLATQA